MKKNRFFVLACIYFIAGTAVHIHAQNSGYLYVLAPNGQEQSFVLDNIRKITFTDETMLVHPLKGSATEMYYEDISKLLIERWRINNEAAAIDCDAKVYSSGGTLFIESSTELTTVNLYNRQGILLQSIAPESLSASLPLPSGQTDMYIVQVVSRKGMSVHKIINK